MALAPPLTLTLTQTKVFTGYADVAPLYAPFTERFGVQSSIVASVPTTQELEAAFVIGPATGVDRERLIRIIDLGNPVDTGLINTPGSFNKLKFFRDQSLDISVSVFGGDILRVTNPPGEWSPDGNLLATRDYEILSVDLPNQRIEMVTPFLWSAQGLTFTVLAPNLVTVRVPTQTTGKTERASTVLSEWRCDQFTTGFGTSPEALDHIASVQAFIASLGLQVKVDIQEYLDAGGNPIINTY